MKLSSVPAMASKPFLGQSFQILFGRSPGRVFLPPFTHPEVTWSECDLSSECIRKAALIRPALVFLQPSSVIVAGLQLCRSLRSETETKSIRIAIWSPGLGLDSRMEFYQAGADEVITDAVIGSESIMRLTSDVRRAVFDQSQIAFADLVLFPDRHIVLRRGKVISLSQFQLQLLQFLMENGEILLSRESLSESLWKDRQVHAASVTTAINRLNHLLSLPGAPDLIHTVRGVGYILQQQ